MNGAFIVASLALVAIPGPNMIYIMTRAATQGRRAGLLSAAGVETGTLVHVVAATFGVAALIDAAPAALTAIRVTGAAYLIWLAVQSLRIGSSPQPPEPARPRRIFTEGVLVNLFNPKVLLFFLAFLPQFTTPDGGRVELLQLGAVFTVLAFILDVIYAFTGGALLRRQPPAYLAAVVYVGLAGYAVLN